LALGLPTESCAPAGSLGRKHGTNHSPLRKRSISAPQVLNEVSAYGSAFARGLRVDLPGAVTQLLISGTASVGENGETLYPGDFRAQLWRTYHNITKLLESEGATWHDVVRTTCYFRDIERDYADFNKIRNEFFDALGPDSKPAQLKGKSQALPASAWRPLERTPKYTIETEPRRKGLRYKEAIVVARGYENQKLVGGSVAEIEYRLGRCKQAYRVVVLRKNISTPARGTGVA
jgi:enamine deaminase RidA (YjgF/YER057c/UK114 family)